ncbi:DUF5753 domain-containing protein [Streptomyces montanus]|uniref:DUF5753 domain-containing protein n=1 Tax=Streptomyces montanus TaxID=2580423 RepID=UPI001FE2C171|nr:DUF5753 domain-containing protein [Streptomyces montanus]
MTPASAFVKKAVTSSSAVTVSASKPLRPLVSARAVPPSICSAARTSGAPTASVYVPGLLQTRAYSTALQKANEVPLEPTEIERLVDIRMKRQEILTRPKPPRLWAILDESVIRRVVGSPQAMKEQLDRLLEANESPHTTLQVLPFSKGAHAAALGSFVIIGGTEPALDVVYVDFHTGSLFLEKDEELDRYRLAFEYLRAQALDMEASSALIHRARKEL